MLNTSAKDINFKPLTPTRAEEYLKNKSQYSIIRNTLIPRYFLAETFCDIINSIRFKRIETDERIKQEIAILELNPNRSPQENFKLKTLKEQKKTIYSDTMKELFDKRILLKIKNTGVSYKETLQLMGSLSNISKTPKEKIQEFTISVNQNLHKNLSKLETYEDEISAIKNDLQNQYFHSKGLGNAISESEAKGFGEQALYVFKQQHKEEIKAKKIDINKLNTYLNSRGII